MPAQHLVDQGVQRRADIMEFVEGYIEANGYSPTLREIGEGVGISSPNSVRNHLHRLQDDGKIDITPNVARSIVLKR